MPVTTSASSDAPARRQEITDILSSEQDDMMPALDVLLDTCWALAAEIEQLDGLLPPHLADFKAKRNSKPLKLSLTCRW